MACGVGVGVCCVSGVRRVVQIRISLFEIRSIRRIYVYMPYIRVIFEGHSFRVWGFKMIRF